MTIFSGMQASASALTAGRLHMDVVANNIANMNTTRGADGNPYRRRYVVQAERTASFDSALARETDKAAPRAGAGVQITAINEDTAPFQIKYDPTHPDADADGNVRLPNINLLQEITDMMLATRLYEANVTAFNAGKAMAQRALEIGR
ncbi:MAG: flgC [Symbiobacteriaceae bacterium]|jgi:flagellar basal-body rod protein FlgC|nr:flgC [Symbiobacteriaceae bacterium]